MSELGKSDFEFYSVVSEPEKSQNKIFKVVRSSSEQLNLMKKKEDNLFLSSIQL